MPMPTPSVKSTSEPQASPQASPRELVNEAVEAALSKKARDIVIMDLRTVNGPATYFVLCTGDSELQIKAIVDGIRERVREQIGERPWHVEGYASKQWVLVDYVDTVVHVFDPERRAFYNLERLWADAPIEHVEDDASA